ncbi:expressed unknown protein [Seminavis robusta]|uniref:Phospholipase D-like domain-containing protein n=1 Tax=Seminavis robusta TaxID=568900 RepID=A0A9N8EIB7_9STRA|nr:expressed unknown protein [Seminavis robusta]|eukprot:Sro1126_g244020.1 n/a (289) ;mRNA; f:630-1496
MEDAEVDVDEIEREKSIEEREEADVRAWFAKRQQSSAATRPGWFIPQLANFLLDGNVNEGDRYYCEPRPKDENVEDVPQKHPLRAMFTAFKSATDNILQGESNSGIPDTEERIIRIYAYSLSCPYVLDLLVHYARHFEIRVILHPKIHSVKMMKVYVDSLPHHAVAGSPRRGIESLKIRIANLQGLNEMASMHRKQVIVEDLTLVSSYNMSLAARCYNWESMFVVKTRTDDVLRFDAMWDELMDRKLLVFDPDERLFPATEREKVREYKAKLSPKKPPPVNPYKRQKT